MSTPSVPIAERNTAPYVTHVKVWLTVLTMSSSVTPAMRTIRETAGCSDPSRRRSLWRIAKRPGAVCLGLAVGCPIGVPVCSCESVVPSLPGSRRTLVGLVVDRIFDVMLAFGPGGIEPKLPHGKMRQLQAKITLNERDEVDETVDDIPDQTQSRSWTAWTLTVGTSYSYCVP